MNIKIPSWVMGNERKFLNELLIKIERCNFSIIDMSSEIKHFSVDISPIFPDVDIDVQIKIDDTEVVLYYGKGFSIRKIRFVGSETVEAFEDFFDFQRGYDYTYWKCFLVENFSDKPC